MRVKVQREWLQKHPTPRASGGDFHWYPGEVDADLRAEIAAGASGEHTVWIAPGSVIVARVFRETAPGDGRSYAGLAVAIAEVAPPVPEARPWDRDSLSQAFDANPLEPMARTDASDGAASAVWAGGVSRAATPAQLAALDTWLPNDVRVRRRRIVIDPSAAEEVRGAGRWLARAARTRGRQPWGAAIARAKVERRALGDFLDDLDALERAWSDAATLRGYLAGAGVRVTSRDHVEGDGAHQWARALHAWGRGRVGPREAVVRVLARRVLIDARANEVVRYQALLPHALADELIGAADA